MKKRFFGKLLLIAPFLLISCAGDVSSMPTSTSPAEESGSSSVEEGGNSSSSQEEQAVPPAVDILDVPAEMERYEGARLYVLDGEEETEVPLLKVMVNDSHSWAMPQSSRVPSAFARVKIRGRITFRLRFDEPSGDSARVLPSGWNIMPSVREGGKVIDFTLYSAGAYSLEPGRDPLKAIMIVADEYGEEPIDESKYENVITLGPGIHTKENNDLIEDNNKIVLESNTLLKLEEGAVLQGALTANGAKNIAVVGPGIIDGTPFDRQKDALVPLDFSSCEGVIIKDVTFLDPSAWVVNLYFTKDALVDGVAIVSSRSNGDGITLQSCENVEVKDCFVRSYDDSLVCKNYALPYGNPDRDSHGSSRNIHFHDIVIWTDLAQSTEIGFETVGEEMENITFKDLTVVHAYHKPVVSIHNGNYADIHDISWENITVDDCSVGLGDAGKSHLVEMTAEYSATWSENPASGGTEIGDVHDIEVRNLLVRSVRSGLSPTFNFAGSKDQRLDPQFKGQIAMVSDVLMEDIELEGEMVLEGDSRIRKNEYTENISFAETGEKVTGATLRRSMSSEELDALEGPLLIE